MVPSAAMRLLHVLAMLCCCSVQSGSKEDGDEYVAAVVEYAPFLPPSYPLNLTAAQSFMMTNIANYQKYAAKAEKAGAQIIVFPEDGIYGFDLTTETVLAYMENLPTSSAISSQVINPCLAREEFENRPILQTLSCMARNLSVAIVANMGDVQPCQPLTDATCATTDIKNYNTDVAFDTDGRLLVKYHKKHLYFEYEFTEPETATPAVFTTSFGVKFGVFTCFDILFEKPAQVLVREYGVKNVAFPTAWISRFSDMVSVEVQQAWSRAMGVNLLAANLHLPGRGFTGSGIYSSGRVASEFMNWTADAGKMLIATVPISPIGTPPKIEGNDHYANKSYKMIKNKYPQFAYKSLAGNEGSVSVCHDSFCCKVAYSRKEIAEELYVLGAFSGLDEHKPEEYKIQVCTFHKCKYNTDISKCYKGATAAETEFSFLSVSGTFSESTFIYPIFMNGDEQLLQPEFVQLDKNSMTYTNGGSVLTAALFGRIYTETERRCKWGNRKNCGSWRRKRVAARDRFGG